MYNCPVNLLPLLIRFECIDRLGIGSSLSIGKNDILGKEIGIKFNSHIEVINNYDTILNFVKSIPKYPDLGVAQK